ncbi:DUF3566 domain-containing protein [Nakamurella flava]|uniref:DUF3566 domain-containing protein n=1 Tax=Nakamurella flava TaxID=2576308 RepID=UPI001F0EB670|nr:DUF3566 domain-containing protein [Nakamurella flava]
MNARQQPGSSRAGSGQVRDDVAEPDAGQRGDARPAGGPGAVTDGSRGSHARPEPSVDGNGGPGLAPPQHVGPNGPNGPTGRTAASRPDVRRPKTPRRPPRLASLQLKRVDPWTVLKISLIVSVVMFFVWMIAVAILYYTLDAMSVWSKINDTFSTLTSSPDTAAAGQTDLITPLWVFGITAVGGAVNIVLFTLLATVGAFVYNAAAAMSGGVELTLGERD